MTKLFPTFPLVPPLTNDGQCYTPSTMKSIHTTSRNYLSPETSSLTFAYYSSHPRFPPPRPPPKKKTLASKVKSMVWKAKRKGIQMANKAIQHAQVVKKNVMQWADHAVETLDSHPRVFSLVTFRESTLPFFSLSFSDFIVPVFGLLLHGTVLQLLRGIKFGSLYIGRISRGVALSTKTKITSGARAFIFIREYSGLHALIVSDARSLVIGYFLIALSISRMITSDARACIYNCKCSSNLLATLI